MRRRGLSNIQWRVVRFATGVSLLVAVPLLVFVWLALGLNLSIVWSAEWLGIPLLVWMLAVIFLVGTITGYRFGNELKKRLEHLMESILIFEKGSFSHRVSPLGADEIGQMADHLNEMARRLEKQVASLQKLSSEKANWHKSMKESVISEERQRLARELHDAVSQQLFAISMMASAVREQMPGDEKIGKRLAMMEKMAGIAQNEMRALLLHLRPATLEGKGLREGVKELLEEFSAKQQTIAIRWEMGDLPRLSKGVEDHLFRILQEGLSNVFRHAEATSVVIRLQAANRRVHLKIIDNGVGFHVGQSKLSSYGLRSIQERAEEIGGVAEILSFPGKGTQIDVKVPIVKEGKERDR
jgi:NarL family two-component system sensor histidine kinase LiaS